MLPDLERDHLTAVLPHSGEFDDWMARNYELSRAEDRQINKVLHPPVEYYAPAV